MFSANDSLLMADSALSTPIQYYLDEYVFKYNRRASKSRGLLFLRLIKQSVKMPPVTYKEIINQNHGLCLLKTPYSTKFAVEPITDIYYFL